MNFEYTWKLLHILWIIPLFGTLVYFASYKRKNILKMVFGENANYAENTTLSPGRRYLRLWLLLAAASLLCIAIARPQWGWRILPFSDRGRDLMIVLDVSKSMRSEDIPPTRLKHAKLFIRNLIKSNPGDRFGLIAFAGSAFLECPLTVDKTSIFQTLDELDTDSIPLGGTNIENALNTAIAAFQGAEGGYRAIILITDGDELSGDSSKSLATLKKEKIPLFVVGIGDPSGDGLIKMTGPDGKTHLLRDAQGELVKSRLNEAQLKNLYKQTGGIYVRSTATEPELAAINKKIKQLIPKKYSTSSSKRPIEKFHYPLCIAVILLLLWFAIGEKRKERAVAMLLGFVLIIGSGNNVSAQNPTPKPALQQLPMGTAVDQNSGEQKSESSKVTPALLYNRALALQMQNKEEEAEKLYKQAINRASLYPEIRSKAFQNLGVLAHRSAREIMQKDPEKALKILDQAEIMYKEAMRSDTRRKRVVLNQQKLLDDRIIAQKIKQQQEDLKKKQEEAKKSVQQACEQQKKENQQKQQQQKKDKEQKKQQQEQSQQQNKQQKPKDQQQDQKENKQNKDQKNSKDQKQGQQPQNQKQNQKKSENNQQQTGKQKKQEQENRQQKEEQQQQSKNTEEKIDNAKNACDSLKQTAEQQKRQDIQRMAEAAKNELKKAEEERKKGDGQQAEEHLQKALQQLTGADDKDKQSKGDQGQESQKSDNKNQNNKENGQQNKGDKNNSNTDRDLAKQQPQQDKMNKGEAGDSEKDESIDPRQAATLLEMMAEDEKNLRDKMKENQRRNSRLKKVLKDW